MSIPAKSRPPFPSGPFLVVGLARSGAAAARLCAARGEKVRGVDAGNPPEAAGLEALGVELNLDELGTEALAGVKTVVKSPGVPQDAPLITAARERGIAVIGELELAWHAIPGPVIAVTGTNGKTTVTEMLGHLYRTAGERVSVAGNVGTALSEIAIDTGLAAAATGRPDSLAGRTVICECSSFQLEDSAAFAPECAVFLNLAPDHLDRHGDLVTYRDAKLRIFANQSNDDVAVFNADEKALEGLDLGGCARRILFCPSEGHGADPDCAVSVAGGVMRWNDEPLMDVSDLQVLGSHNVANAMAAAAAALSMGIAPEAVRAGLASFTGVAHRLERVAGIDGVSFANDSKATNVEAASVGLRAFPGGVHVILGGSLKDEDFAPLAQPVSERCEAAYLIGEAAEVIEAALASVGQAGVEVRRCADLAAALDAAAEAAQPGETVLLSPACASFDAFKNFEERGDVFRALVEARAGR